ncbi:hypothetical protein [Prevotella fusca]|uniref:Uncharacterized protein n=1 Tax=Prevotella fusca JCM 17724 TaxID=1236517 RepID=A0A0K1NNY4_9BACT|nr:hypothetical protein [Prevotella fusca]AKU70396.1 hypothetical protein ADJ77_11575 [Prevotella fusca JCM 17724]QUB86030.1 hypothetical protein J5A51_01830 [Prevotella fusca JCM 17724]
MARQFFVLGIGGTGMRCIESLIHLCAMGMFDDTDIHLLALDTDKNNGNFSRLKEVKDAYCNAKGQDKASRVSLNNSFFSANIKYYEFSPNYEQKSTFKAVFNYGDTQYNHREETDLADLVLSDNVEDFNLRHGYRAQTHLGSMMMYHSILEAAESQASSELKLFLSELIKASQNGQPRVFILGSVFGGTGASSIPIIPQAISKAAEIMSNGAANVLKSAYFGSTLLTAYFSFRAPSGGELDNQKIIATSDKFALNSQVAMMFYDDDATVKSTYQKFYMMGTSSLNWDPMQRKADTISETITGGEQQKNDSHYIELLAACAALDFYNSDENELQQNKNLHKTDYQYRAVNESGKLDFEDFVGKERAKEFARKFGMLIAFSLFCNGEDDFVESTRAGGQKEIQEFIEMDITQATSLKNYFRLFFVKRVADKLQEGWLRQIHRSAGGQDSFLFNANLFSPMTFKELMNMDWNECIYRNEGIGKDNKYSKSGIIGFRSKFDPFKKQFIQERDSSKDWQNLTNKGEQLYKLIFDTLAKLYKFN